jgi:hypothetical protein
LRLGVGRWRETLRLAQGDFLLARRAGCHYEKGKDKRQSYQKTVRE